MEDELLDSRKEEEDADGTKGKRKKDAKGSKEDDNLLNKGGEENTGKYRILSRNERLRLSHRHDELKRAIFGVDFEPVRKRAKMG